MRLRGAVSLALTFCVTKVIDDSRLVFTMLLFSSQLADVVNYDFGTMSQRDGLCGSEQFGPGIAAAYFKIVRRSVCVTNVYANTLRALTGHARSDDASVRNWQLHAGLGMTLPFLELN